MNERKLLDALASIAIVGFGLGMTMLMWGDYQLYGHSALFDYFRQLGFDEMIRAGIFYPRWLPDAYYGYGSPHFHFYAPLPYYINEAFVIAGMPVHIAIKAGIISALVASGLGMYLMCRDFAGRLSSTVAAIFYMMAPYHLVDIFVRHALGENLAFTLLPFVIWGLSGMVFGNRGVRFFVGSISLAALIFAHNVSAMLAMGPVLLWLVMLGVWQKDWRSAAWGAGLLACGIAISAFFWAPVMADKHLTYAEESLTEEFFEYSDHFVAPFQLVVPSWGYGGSQLGVDDGMSLQVGIAHLVLVLAALGFLLFGAKRERKTTLLVLFGALVFAGSVFMTLSGSTFAYELIPLLKYVQFPSRFLLFAAFGASLLAVVLDPLAQTLRKPWALPLCTAAAVLLVSFFSQAYLRPRAQVFYEEEQEFHSAHLSEIRGSLANSNLTPAWQLGGLEYWREQGETATSLDDYLPRVCKPASNPRGYHAPESVPAEFAWWTGDEQVDVRWRFDGPVDLIAEFDGPSSGSVEFARFLFPGWTARVNGKLTDITPHDLRGTILVPVQAGPNVIELRFGRTDRDRMIALFSLLALAFTAIYAARESTK